MPKPKRAVAFIDGFNLYHSIKNLGLNHYKWLDLHALIRGFAPTPDFEIRQIFYFTAYAYWRPQSQSRHKEYVAALSTTGVIPVMGRFKEKDRKCQKCGNRWIDHEEKETDVNIGISLVSGALQENFDRAILLSRDSDLVPAVKKAKQNAPSKEIVIMSPAWEHTPSDLIRNAGGRGHHKKIKPIHLERSLLPAAIPLKPGGRKILRPKSYDPPE